MRLKNALKSSHDLQQKRLCSSEMYLATTLLMHMMGDDVKSRLDLQCDLSTGRDAEGVPPGAGCPLHRLWVSAV